MEETVEDIVQEQSFVVTVDGPAASGKTSVSRDLAKKLGWPWVSTGAFYRGLAYVAMKSGVPLQDEAALAELCLSPQWQVKLAAQKTHVFMGEQDVTDQVLLEEIGNAASQISQFPAVRANLLAAQRACAQAGTGLVAEGRDCGTVVFPKAQVKFYLTAHSENRAARRARQQGADVQKTAAEQRRRDDQDRERTVAPMQIPAGAHVIDTSELSLKEVVDQVYALVQEGLK